MVTEVVMVILQLVFMMNNYEVKEKIIPQHSPKTQTRANGDTRRGMRVSPSMHAAPRYNDLETETQGHLRHQHVKRQERDAYEKPTRMFTCRKRHTDIHTYIHTHTHIHACIHTYIHIHTYMHAYIQTNKHTYIYIQTHIYIHTHTYTQPPPSIGTVPSLEAATVCSMTALAGPSFGTRRTGLSSATAQSWVATSVCVCVCVCVGVCGCV